MFRPVVILRTVVALTLLTASSVVFSESEPDPQVMKGRALRAVVSELRDSGFACSFPTPFISAVLSPPAQTDRLVTKCSKTDERMYADRWDEIESVVTLESKELSNTALVVAANLSVAVVRSNSTPEYLSFPTQDKAVADYIKDDRQLNAIYKKVVSAAQTWDPRGPSGNARQLIVEYEKTWIRFRDSYCELYGRVKSDEARSQDTLALHCKAKVTSEQIRFLGGMYRCLQDPRNRCQLPLFGYTP